jgi:hypothetical protein
MKKIKLYAIMAKHPNGTNYAIIADDTKDSTSRGIFKRINPNLTYMELDCNIIKQEPV